MVVVVEVSKSVVIDVLVVDSVAGLSGSGPDEDEGEGPLPDWPATKGLPETWSKSIQEMLWKNLLSSNWATEASSN